MTPEWHRTFRSRMNQFEHRHMPPRSADAVSIKIRVGSGCFHREHSPRAYELIDEYLEKIEGHEDFELVGHESGPELLLYVAAITAGISLAKNIIDLIVAILKARSEGIKKGDHPAAPLELIVRRVLKDGEFKEETILRIGHDEVINRKMIEKNLRKSISDLLKSRGKGPESKSPAKNKAKGQRVSKG
jgi:hypothetical protein